MVHNFRWMKYLNYSYNPFNIEYYDIYATQWNLPSGGPECKSKCQLNGLIIIFIFQLIAKIENSKEFILTFKRLNSKLTFSYFGTSKEL